MNEFIPGHTTTNFRDRPDRCPACGKLSNAATSVRPGPGHSPGPGSVSLCYGCGALLTFNENLRLRQPTTAERDQIEQSPEWPFLRGLQAEIHAYRKSKMT